MASDAFYVTVYKRLHFHLSPLETERFQNDASPLSKPFSAAFSGVLVWMIGKNVLKNMRFQTKMWMGP